MLPRVSIERIAEMFSSPNFLENDEAIRIGLKKLGREGRSLKWH